MRRVLSLLIIFSSAWMLFDDVVFAQKSDTKTESESKIIDLTADVVYPMTIDDTVDVMCLVGNFAAQHNGAIITADSAVRYNDKRLECFGNVLINQNTTYAYADRADYNGELNEVILYAPIVKMIDGDATLYTYNFTFNTLDNIAIYDGGGVMINGDDVMESVSGYYYSDTKELIGVGDVELKGDNYQMTSDSVIYNTESESAQYFDNTNIWNEKDEYLYADLGDYVKAEDRYSFYRNGYILTDEQEVWSDSMDYYRAEERVYMRSNIQIDDTTQKSLIFADYGEYFKDPGDITLYGRPVVVSYDLEEGDSLFMRADTFKVFTLDRFADSVKREPAPQPTEAEEVESELNHESHEGHDHDHNHEGHSHSAEEHATEESADVSTPEVVAPKISADEVEERKERVAPDGEQIVRDSLPQRDSLPAVDSLQIDSLALDSMALDSLSTVADTLNWWQKLKRDYLAKRAIKLEEKAVRDAERKIVLDSIAIVRQTKITAKLNAEKAREARRVLERKTKIQDKAIKKRDRDVARGKILSDESYGILPDSVFDALTEQVEEMEADTLVVDSLAVDSLALDSLSLDSMKVDSVAVDSLYKLLKGYRNVKIYRSDFQSVADSIATNSIDSIIRMYIDPVLWHENNQVTSDEMNIYTANQTIDKAVFIGSPIMASEVAGTYYNQVAGKEMTSLFANGEIYRNNVDGNAQTIYYMQDEEGGEVTGMMVMESGSASFYIKDQAVEGITYRQAPTYTLYPMNKIPPTQEPTLKGFVWEADRRPTRDEIFDRRQRPSQREEKSEVKRPEFPITEELNALREDLTRARMWSDRVDVVPALAEEWMESLGYKTGQPRKEEK